MRATTPLSQHTRRVKLSRTRNGSMKPTVSRVSHCRVKSPVLFTCTSKNRIESAPRDIYIKGRVIKCIEHIRSDFIDFIAKNARFRANE